MKNPDVKNCHEPSTRENILKATLELINEEGIDSITIRKVAARANTNIALINYHFKSKENLLDQVIREYLLSKFKNVFNLLEEPDVLPKVKLKNFLVNYANCLLENVDIFKKALLTGKMVFNSQHDFVIFLTSLGFNKLQKVISEITGEKDPLKLTFYMFQIAGGIIFPIIATPVLNEEVGFTILSKKNIEIYVDTLISNYFDK